MKPALGPLTLYGSRISYYTGKLEAYLRYRQIPYELRPTVGNESKLKAGTGVVQMPVVELGDGRWMTDTTPILAWLEHQQDGASIYPADPGLNFIACLIEDYADEWLWRSAMHYRWSYRIDRHYAAETLYQELIKGIRPLPRQLALRLLKRRQYGGFVRGDGVNRHTRQHTDETYLNALAPLQDILQTRPFLLGETPSIADFGLMAPMFRHFSQDPTPAELMRNRAPHVYAWVARMWSLSPQSSDPAWITELDGPLEALLVEICDTHLEQLRANAAAYSRGLKRYDQSIQGCTYHSVPTSRYRVWCLETLQQSWADLDSADQQRLKSSLNRPSAAVLWDAHTCKSSDYDVAQDAPFNRAINVFGTGVPPR